jgi:hypothetical protein
LANLTAEEVTNWYLYGPADAPTNFADDKLIRPQNGPNISSARIDGRLIFDHQVSI